jgi:UPF0176 protein
VFHIATFYRFVPIADPAGVCDRVTEAATAGDVTGSIVIATEGINGTVSGQREDVAAIVEHLRAVDGLGDLTLRWSTAEHDPFRRLRVRAKPEIVTLGLGDVDVAEDTGVHVDPRDWDRVIDRRDVVVVDVRNTYEVEIGSFPGAVDPGIDAFAEFPSWVASDPRLADRPPVAMFCTGGIRCEKASAHLRRLGFDEVYQLEGGILSYLASVRPDASSWEGECYVFDGRVSVGHDLVPGSSEICPNCNRVVGDDARSRPGYEPGVTCHRCHQAITEDRRRRFAERQRQVDLARARGSRHLGPTP